MIIKSPSKTIRIVSYNILNNSSCYTPRVLSLRGEIEKVNPDVLLFQEVLEVARPLLEEQLAELGFVYKVYAPIVPHFGKGAGTAIFSKFPFTGTEILEYEDFSGKWCDGNPPQMLPAVAAFFEVDGQPVGVMSAHLCWGFEHEGVRFLQAQWLSKYAEQQKLLNPDLIMCFGGDLNASEHSATIQLLKGRGLGDNHYSTLWIDAWEVHGNEQNWSTTDPHLYWNKVTSAGVGIPNPNASPVRRIDYLFTHGWCYGRLGYPTSFGRFGDEFTYDENEPSDHYGIYMDIAVAYE